jgi:deoxycytidylate deaminase
MNIRYIIIRLKAHAFLNMTRNEEISSHSKKYNVVAAVISKDGCILSFGENSYTKTHPTQKKYAHTVGHAYHEYLHAEIDALVKNFGYGLVVVRFTKKGELAMAKPCEICMLAIKESSVERIWYSDKDRKIKTVKIKRG